jgi:hypothetical protein
MERDGECSGLKYNMHTISSKLKPRPLHFGGLKKKLQGEERRALENEAGKAAQQSESCQRREPEHDMASTYLQMNAH